LISPSSSEVKGSILSKTSEYLTLAFTHAAKGAAACEELRITESSKLAGVAEINLLTFVLS